MSNYSRNKIIFYFCQTREDYLKMYEEKETTSEYDGSTLKDVLYDIDDPSFKPGKEEQDFYDLLKQMLNPNPQYRICPQKALTHSFFQRQF